MWFSKTRNQTVSQLLSNFSCSDSEPLHLPTHPQARTYLHAPARRRTHAPTRTHARTHWTLSFQVFPHYHDFTKSSTKWHSFLHRLLSNQLWCEPSWKMVLSQRITQKLHRHKKVSDELLCTRIKITRRWSPAYVYAYMKATIVPVTALVFIFHE